MIFRLRMIVLTLGGHFEVMGGQITFCMSYLLSYGFTGHFNMLHAIVQRNPEKRSILRSKVIEGHMTYIHTTVRVFWSNTHFNICGTF